jgi:hypothetical protein
VDDVTGCSVVLPDYAGSAYIARQAAYSMALVPLAAVIDMSCNTLAAGEQDKYLQPCSTVYPAGQDIRVIF